MVLNILLKLDMELILKRDFSMWPLDHAPTKKEYPEKLRRVKFFYAENNRRFVFLTNQFGLPPV